MQEIFVDTDSLDELTMVIQDLFSRRKRAFCGHESAFDDSWNCWNQRKLNHYKIISHANAYAPPYFSSVVLRVRITTQEEQEETDPDQKEIHVVDLSEYNEPIEDLKKMVLDLEASSSSLSLDTRIWQLIFEKLRKVEVFQLLSFINISTKNTEVG